MRPECYECVLKHVGKAAILAEEAMLGYPEHIHLAAANLDEAASEILQKDAALAMELRDIRLKMMEGWWLFRAGKIPALEYTKHYSPEFMELISRIDETMLEEEMAQQTTEKEVSNPE